VAMATRAGALWRRLEADSGRVLLHATDQLSFGDEGSLSAIATALSAHDAPCEELSALEARRRFPDVAVRGPALLEPSSGVLAAHECLRAVCAVGGFVVHTGATVTALEQDDAGVRVTMARGETLTADVVVNCAGPAALALLGETEATEVSALPSAPQVAYFRSADPRRAGLPVLIEWGDDMVYGLPVPGGERSGLYKISHHTPGPPLSSYDPVDPLPLSDEPSLLATLTEAVRRLLPSLDPEPVATERCIYDNTADADFVLDRVGRIVVGCGTSGHGFKFGPLLGEVLADLAEGITPRVDVAPFCLRRSVQEPGADHGPAAGSTVAR